MNTTTVVAPYNANPELVAMKEDIAQRKLNVKIKGMLIGGALLLLGVVALGAVAMAAPGAAVHMAGFAQPLIYAAMAGGSAIVGLATMKEVKKLEMDEQYLSSYMSGKNYWGEGYREEVAEKGYSMAGPAVAMSGPPAQHGRGRTG